MSNWDEYFLDLAAFVATRSKDPSTKIGAVVVRPDKTVASMGFNGFPRGVYDLKYRYTVREVKYKYVVHAEANAIVSAREPLHGHTIYVSPMLTCCACAGLIIQAGIKRVVSWRHLPNPRWEDDHSIARQMYAEAGVALDEIEKGEELPPV